MPRPTKNSVTKKSRRWTTRDTTSYAYGEVAIVAPAISAPISIDTETRTSSPSVLGDRAEVRAEQSPTPKHQPSASVTTSSGERATMWNARDSTHARDHRRERRDDRGADERQHDRRDRRVREARLQREEHDRPDVLEDQQADREPARDGVELQVLLQVLDDEQRRRERARDAEVERGIEAGQHAQPVSPMRRNAPHQPRASAAPAERR